jgi:hypothetical protein
MAAALLLMGGAALASACAGQPEPLAEEAPTVSGGVSAARGEYLVSIAGCHDCHTPWKMGAMGPEPDMTRPLSGHPAEVIMPPPPDMPMTGLWLWAGSATNTAFAGPWGVSYAFNLTPDQNTGLGIWTEDMFVNAIRTGRHMGTARPILPPMPWPVYNNMTDDDLKSVFAYLKSIPAISNRVPDPVIVEPPAPAN